jgi:hypothetical protein
MAHTAQSRAPHAWSLLLGALGLGLGLGLSARAWPFLVDDAFIVARYARRLAQGLGYTFQAGAASDGVTGPLWLLSLSAGARLGFDPVWLAKVLGMGCAASGLVLLLQQARHAQGGRARLGWLALFLGSAGPFWIWAVGGLETSAAALLCTMVALGSLRRPAPAALGVGLGAGLLAWLRPDLAPWVALQLAIVFVRERRAGMRALACALGGPLTLLGFRWIMFGHLLPLSVHAKPALLTNGLGYLLESARKPAALLLLPWLALAFWQGGQRTRLACAGLAVHALALVLAGGDWMQGARLFVPLVPVACLVAAEAVVRSARRRRNLVWILAGATILLRAGAAWHEASLARVAGLLRERQLPRLLAAVARHADPVAALDIGALGYYSEHSFVDLGGLVEPRVAYAPGGHVAKRIDSAWLAAMAPGVIVLHSRVEPRVDDAGHVRWFAGYPVERHVLALPWVLRDYRVTELVPYADDYFYLVLAPRRSAQR